jgi:hypothetical protein
VAKHPSITDKRGYQYSQLFSHSPRNTPYELIKKYLTTNNLTDYYNLKIGVAYVEASHRISEQEVFDCCGDHGIESSSKERAFMGVDQGKTLHVVVSVRHPTKKAKYIHIGEYKDWEEVDKLMRKFNVVRCVIDAMPETRNARKLAKKYKGKVFLCYYNDNMKGSYKWNEAEQMVSVNRTESLDSSHREIVDAQILYPAQTHDVVKEFAKQIHNTAKKLEEDEAGNKRYVYVKLGADHYRHAANYETIARQSSSNLLFVGLK